MVWVVLAIYDFYGTYLKKKDWVSNTFDKIPNIKLEYFQIADENTLLPCLRKVENKKYRAFIAVFINNIRLIDTIALK